MRRLSRRGGALAAVVVLVGMVGFGLPEVPTAGAATVSGPDLTASIGLPAYFAQGNPAIDLFEIANVGNQPATGTTTVTLSMPPSVSMSLVSYYTCNTSPPGTCSISQSVQPNGQLVFSYTGTIPAGTVLSNFEVLGAITNPPVSSGEVAITVANAGDVDPANNTTTAVYGGPPPTVTGLSPTSGPPGGGTTVTLTGTNLGAGAVTIGGVTSTGTFCNDTMCTAVTPGGPSTAAVQVATANGTVSAGTFTYTSSGSKPPPVITAISPNSGPAAGGTTVTVTGTNLSGGSVTFGSTGAPPGEVFCSASSCAATSPPGTGTVDVHVTTFWGTSTARSADRFTYQAATPPPPTPMVSAISPNRGSTAGGTAVVVSGSNLTGGSVAFGGVAALSQTCSASSCTATAPAGSGTVDVTVTTAAGTSTLAAADHFTYQSSPPPPTGNLVPDPGFETAGVPSDSWGSSLARSTTVAHSGSWSLAQTASSSSGGWDLDSDSGWYAPITSADTYTASIWAWSAKAVKVDLNVDLLNSGGNDVDSANGPTISLAANTWTQLSITGIHPTSSEISAAFEPNFSGATKGGVINWDDMSLTSP